MNTIYQALSNVKHNGDLIAAGTFFEAELGQFDHLVAAGIMRVVEGAKSIEDAAKIVAAEAAAKIEETAAPEVAAPDTWGPTKEPVVAPEAPAAPVAPTAEETQPAAPATPTLAKFTVLKEFEITNPESKNFGKHTIGDVIEAEASAAQSLVDDGTLVLEGTPTGDNL